MHKRVNITLSEQVLARADRYAAEHCCTRSGLIEAALNAFTGEGARSGDASVEARTRVACAPARPRLLDLERVERVLRAFFATRDEVDAAWVFGSVAAGTAGPMSDVDVAVLPSGVLAADGRWRLRLDLGARLPGVIGVREVDVTVFPDVSVMLAFEIASRGIQVFGEDGYQAAETMIRSLSDYWDYEYVIAQARRSLGERMREYARAE